MSRNEPLLERISEEQRDLLFRFLPFADTFSIDWFSGQADMPPSKLLSTIRFLEGQQWVAERDDQPGVYGWTRKLPRQDLTARISPSLWHQYCRSAADMLRRHLPGTAESLLRTARLCVQAGLQQNDLEGILLAALHEEENHKISSAVELYDCLLEYVESAARETEGVLTPELSRILVQTIERRASLSLFHPNLKKINTFLSTAMDAATKQEDLRALASLHLLIGQNFWMAFQHERAVEHFDTGWSMIDKGEKDALYRRGLQLQALSAWIRGDLSGAVQAYEDSLGELDSVAADDFSQLIALHLALCYTQVGMPQRGLGITEAIQQQAKKAENGPLLSVALATTGVIFLEIRQLKNSRTYFDMALEIARREGIPMAEVMAGIGLSNIACLEGDLDAAAEQFKTLWKLRKSSWYHTLNSPHVFEAGYVLHRKGRSPVELEPVINFLYSLGKDQVNPFLYSIIRHRQVLLIERGTAPVEKISELLEIEKSLGKLGAVLELAKLRITLTRLFLQTNNWRMAETYALKAWEVAKSVARDVFPREIFPLLPQEDISEKDRLFDLVVEMGEAVTNQKNIEQLLTNVITSLTRLTGAERAAIFIRGKDPRDLEMVASRNLSQETLRDERFGDTIQRIRIATEDPGGHIMQYDVSGPDAIDFRRVIITPLTLGKNVIGALYQDSRFFSFDISAGRLKLLSALASQIAVSIDRAQAYDEIARLNDRLLQENVYYREETEEFRPFGDIIGTSEIIVRIHRLIAKVAPTVSTVLIHGETGVGKELIARAIHRESPRQKGPFIRVNCAALPESLIDSELFGHEKGAFTGAIKMKAGRFELANNGTIFLDEVSELPPSTQSRLLRILQEKEFQRVGGTRLLFSDFRLITATNKDLQKEVEKGRFRDDLFYRLNVFPIAVPPLRQRKEDIPLLASHFLKLFSTQYNRPDVRIHEAEMEALKTYPWPGNIRELANMVERAVILGGSRIRFPELATGTIPVTAGEEPLPLQEMERLHILQSLKTTRGKIGGKDGAAALLGLKRTTLINRMKKLGITLERSPSRSD
ncbi:MAG: sigma 54-interacting transcriptional regulator [Syntrophales bacterium]